MEARRPGDRDEGPKALATTDYTLKGILIATAIQGAILAVIKAVVTAVLDRGGARLFERWTGE